MTLAPVVQEKNIRSAVEDKKMFLQHCLLCVVSGVLVFISFPDFNFFPAAFVCLVPLLFVLRKSKNVFFCGLLCGVVAYSGILYWIIPTFINAKQGFFLGLFCLFLLSLYCAIYYGIFLYLYKSINFSSYLIRILSGSALWVSLEYLRTYFLSGFPWGILGYSQWKFLSLIQISHITGIYGISFIIVFSNITFYEILSTLEKKEIISNLKKFTLLLLVFLFVILYGYFKIEKIKNLNNTEGYNFLCLQGNIDQYKKWDINYKNEIMERYFKLAEKSKSLSPEIIVWPESAVPGYLLNDKTLMEWVKKILNITGCSHLIGTVIYKDKKFYNSAILITYKGEIIGIYHKMHLVPFGETIPFKRILSKIINVLNELGDFSPGEKSDVLSLMIEGKSVLKLSANICYEAIFPEISRLMVKKGANVIVNITNDAWYMKTSAARQHFIFNIFRAVENSRPVVRCANTGISGFISPYGKVIAETEIFMEDIISCKVKPSEKITFYTKYGDIFALLCVILSVFSMILLIYFKKTNQDII